LQSIIGVFYFDANLSELTGGRAIRSQWKNMAEFVPASIDDAKNFLTEHHLGVLATRRKDGRLQMSPITSGLDADGRVIISSRETAYKVTNLRRDPRAALCVFTKAFHGGGWVQVNGPADIISLPGAMDSLVYLQRQVYGEHKSWPEFHERMVRERRVIIRFAIESVAPLRRG
jgi:PPOX class probable F420-dependent enzyme